MVEGLKVPLRQTLQLVAPPSVGDGSVPGPQPSGVVLLPGQIKPIGQDSLQFGDATVLGT